jgi:hypothetical protein
MPLGQFKAILLSSILVATISSLQLFTPNIISAQDLDEMMDRIMDNASEDANDAIKRQIKEETMETVNEDITLQSPFSGVYSVSPNAFGLGTLKSTSTCSLQVLNKSISGNCTLIDNGLAFTGSATISGNSGDGINYTIGFNITTGSGLPAGGCFGTPPGTGTITVVSGSGEVGTTLSASTTASTPTCATMATWSLIKK